MSPIFAGMKNVNHDLQNDPQFIDLQKHYREIAHLGGAISLMYWDQGTYMPSGASGARGDQISTLAKICHQRATDPKLARLLEDLKKKSMDTESDSFAARFIHKAAKDLGKIQRLPEEFVGRQSAHFSQAYEAWKKAREAQNFSLVESITEKTLDLSHEYASFFPEFKHPLDPLIDSSDEGFLVEDIEPVFARLRAELVSLLDEITYVPAFDHSCVRQKFPEDLQLEFGKSVIEQMGYSFATGRQDKTAHPFMIRLAGDDVRITTRVQEMDFTDAFFSTVHEAGHALYEMGIDPQFDQTPLGSGTSSCVHESQSRLWENLVARSFGFWEHFFPLLQAKFPAQLGKTSLNEFYRAINRVERSLIRTDSDEVTYNLHVMIRFDLEKQMLERKLKIRDLPEAWNARYKSDLGITPPSLSEGVLQDVHWFHGPIGGAFQGYTLGNIMSAQFYSAALAKHPEIQTQISKGEFATLREWLRTNLHTHGAKFDSQETLLKATGQKLNIEPYVQYLRTKYRTIIQH